MNITDLREELHLRADELSADPSTLRAGVTARVTTTRRRRAAGVGGGVGAAALAVGILLTSQPGQQVVPAPAITSTRIALGADGMPSRSVPDAPGDVIKDGLRIRARVADNVLAAGVIGDAGQRSISTTWTPTTSHISYNAECWLPPDTDRRVAEKTMVRVSISGIEGFFASFCQTEPPVGRDLPASSIVPGEPGVGHPELEVGVEATLTVELVTRAGARTTVPGARLAGSVYDLGLERRIENEFGSAVVALPELIEHQGYLYRLETLVTRPAAEGPLPEAATPADVPFLVTYGSSPPTRYPKVGTLYLTGLDTESAHLENGGRDIVPQPARPEGRVELRAEGARPIDGVAFLGIYTPVD
jgi:hypothetical protein